MLLTVTSLIIGAILLWIGGEGFVRGSVAIARRLNVSQLMIGLTLVGFGTSLPELTTSVTAALEGAPGLAVGNVIGSNIANILLILAVAALIKPMTANPAAFYRDAIILAVVSVIGAAYIYFGQIGRLDGSIFLAILVGYIAFIYATERRNPGAAAEMLSDEAHAVELATRSYPKLLAIVAAGLVGVIVGAWLFVFGASALALAWGVSKTFVGLTVVAVGTSLPELAITGIASFRGKSDVALGNIMGSNLFNILAILGITALASPIKVPPEIRLFDILVMLAATAVFIWAVVSGRKISRRVGVLQLAGFILYTVIRTSMTL